MSRAVFAVVMCCIRPSGSLAAHWSAILRAAFACSATAAASSAYGGTLPG